MTPKNALALYICLGLLTFSVNGSIDGKVDGNVNSSVDGETFKANSDITDDNINGTGDGYDVSIDLKCFQKLALDLVEENSDIYLQPL